jgi:transposase
VIETGDINSLREQQRLGRSPRLSLLQQKELKEVLQQSPEKSGMNCNIWDEKSLSAYIKEHYGIDLKVRACQKFVSHPWIQFKAGSSGGLSGRWRKEDAFKKNFKRK